MWGFRWNGEMGWRGEMDEKLRCCWDETRLWQWQCMRGVRLRIGPD